MFINSEEEYERLKAEGKWDTVSVPKNPETVYKMYPPVKRQHDTEDDYEKLRRNKTLQDFLERQRRKKRKEAKEAAKRAREQAMADAKRRAEKKRKRRELRVATAADLSVAEFSIEHGVEVTPHSTTSNKGKRRFSKLRDDDGKKETRQIIDIDNILASSAKDAGDTCVQNSEEKESRAEKSTRQQEGIARERSLRRIDSNVANKSVGKAEVSNRESQKSISVGGGMDSKGFKRQVSRSRLSDKLYRTPKESLAGSFKVHTRERSRLDHDLAHHAAQ